MRNNEILKQWFDYICQDTNMSDEDYRQFKKEYNELKTELDAFNVIKSQTVVRSYKDGTYGGYIDFIFEYPDITKKQLKTLQKWFKKDITIKKQKGLW